MKISKYHTSILKKFLDIFLSLILLILSSPIFILIALTTRLTSKGPVFFIQKRTGKDEKEFEIIKFRTMKVGADKLQKKYFRLNESDGPVFKIADDPRFTPFGKILSRTGFDELPQFFNVIKGDMSLVGPRPLPIDESKKLNIKQKQRCLIKPGITSSWVIKGSHQIPFKKWMELDLDYVRNADIVTDILIFLSTLYLTSISILKLIFIR